MNSFMDTFSFQVPLLKALCVLFDVKQVLKMPLFCTLKWRTKAFSLEHNAAIKWKNVQGRAGRDPSHVW